LIVEILETLFLALVSIMMAYLVRHYVFTLTVLKNSRRQQLASCSENTAFKSHVSILIPACNEELVIGRILRRMLELTYPRDRLQIVVVDDGSTDGTGRIADQYAENHPQIEVIHRSCSEGRRGKASALNAGLKKVNGEIVLCFDADYFPRRNIVEQLVREFADPKVGGVQGRVTVLNEPKNIVTRLVALERIGGYRVDQEARSSLGLTTQFGGTAGGFRRSLLDALGGWDETMLAEDTDITFRVYLAGYVIRYVNEAECYEEAVESWRAYWRQRYRWSRGHMEVAFKHFGAVLKSRQLGTRSKIDALLLLNIYFVPVLVLLSWVLSVPLALSSSRWLSVGWCAVSLSIYGFVGNSAPFFEVGTGAYLDGRKRAHWLISLLFLTFLYNIPICTKALADLLLSKILHRNTAAWCKTTHFGDGNSYIMN
jgi:cellulose synthase/poly-beta-1,6-N-acetylglucosamine synthase-like glycosyltransferase